MQWPKAENKINWNTLVSPVLTLCILFGGWVWWFSGQSSSIETLRRDFQTYVATHSDLHKDRNVSIETSLTDIRARLSQAENNIVNDKRALDNHEYRITVLSAGAENLTSSVSEIKTEMGEMRSDIRLTNQRLEQVINLLGAQPNPRATQ